MDDPGRFHAPYFHRLASLKRRLKGGPWRRSRASSRNVIIRVLVEVALVVHVTDPQITTGVERGAQAN